MYGTPEMRDYTLTCAQTLGQIASDKIQLAGGVETDSLDQADFVLFIHCGSEKKETTPKLLRISNCS